MTLQLRPMTDVECDAWQIELARVFVEEAVAAGRSMPEDAVERELTETRELLPQGASTPRMLVLMAVDADRNPVGRAWAGLDHPRGQPDTAFLYDIEVAAQLRGTGLGRELLAAVERAVADAGVGSLALNVFGNNPTAIGLYDSAGYQTTSIQMRKSLF
ncbi:MAG: GNAT family N-acetyltransferase [Pseudolysinimonas sp.]